MTDASPDDPSKPPDGSSFSSSPSRLSAQADALRALLFLAISRQSGQVASADRLRSAFDVIMSRVRADAWLAIRFTQQLDGTILATDRVFGTDPDSPLGSGPASAIADWADGRIEQVRSHASSFGFRPPRSTRDRPLKSSKPRTRSWVGTTERAVISTWRHPPTDPAGDQRLAVFTWFSLHRFPASRLPFVPKDRWLLQILHEQAAWTLMGTG